ncbi:hypothetical protein AYL99_03898 [Fonsecaea erecta]|uniref:Carrier domain-containing protein n=1 Tax=Fonsecaea erecta TaxID=1367422 RepID=A0A178ZRS4_9EURO|nr:hypothetical protein AYL99_03898 [Fonsecaea erecta]OAP61695.1 hypothetical protein AYL99_03898 [Fonsecaea erecta]
MEVNYFTCTLDQAIKYQHEKSYRTIAEFIDFKAQNFPEVPVLGLYELAPKSPSQVWTSHVLTFRDVQKGINLVAEALLKTIVFRQGQTVALLCPSSPGLLFTWLALIWQGHPVLLIAPQCSPSAIAQLCKSCEVELMLYEDPYGDLATKASRETTQSPPEALRTHLIPFARENIVRVLKNTFTSSPVLPAHVQETDVAYLHHTSGTSSGVPKPIPQTHRAAVGVLPVLDGTRQATFTTTPLYHGGVADLFRAWTSNAMIWLFPGKDLPITAANICKCLDGASTAAGDGTAPETKYFSSVPYVLKMLAEDRDGIEHLRTMDIVGVGGAALPAEVGDSLINKDNVNLISRFGSAECGFLMSSHRDYAKDKEWKYLRSSTCGKLLQFEPQSEEEEGLSELVIRPGWPHMAKRNREDGSFATADLFSPHPTIPDAWRYHSRADSQLTLITGKKFDPAPLEDAIRASASSVIEDILIFGNGRPYPGALAFPRNTAQSSGGDFILQKIAPVVEEMNRQSPSHARIPKHMLIPMDPLDGGLEKSSKGTILRGKAEERFAEKIAAAYEGKEEHINGTGPPPPEVPDDEIPARVRTIVETVVGEGDKDFESHPESLTDDTDLFAYGVDSVACIQIRRALSQLLPSGSTLPLSVVQDTGNVAGLSDLILRMRAGKGDRQQREQKRDKQAQHQLMLDLVEEYSVFDGLQSELPSPSASPPARSGTSPNRESKRGMQVLLTGPTGSLGAHILHQLLSSPSISKIHLLVRGTTATASRERILKALTSRRLPVPECFDMKTQIHSCRLSDSKLGLSDETYEALADDVDVIVHLAWSVNFLLPLRAFAQTHLAGTKNLINFALASSVSNRGVAPKFIFCSSVAAVSAYSSTTTIPESVLSDPAAAGPTGYAQSKWVAEQICHGAVRQLHRLRNRVSITRVGQLSGARDTGVWSRSEAYPLMLSSFRVTGCLPDLDRARRAQGQKNGEILAWLPVDLAARAFVEDILNEGDGGSPRQVQKTIKDVRTMTGEPEVTSTGGGEESPPVYHILNPATRVTWSDLLSWVVQRQGAGALEIVPIHEWLSRLSRLQDASDAERHNHPALRLLGFWEEAYRIPGNARRAIEAEGVAEAEEEEKPQRGNGCPDRTRSEWNLEAERENADKDVGVSAVPYQMAETYVRLPSLREPEGLVNEEYVSRMWEWIMDNV